MLDWIQLETFFCIFIILKNIFSVFLRDTGLMTDLIPEVDHLSFDSFLISKRLALCFPVSVSPVLLLRVVLNMYVTPFTIVLNAAMS